jgi:hypothetical protein
MKQKTGCSKNTQDQQTSNQTERGRPELIKLEIKKGILQQTPMKFR